MTRPSSPTLEHALQKHTSDVGVLGLGPWNWTRAHFTVQQGKSHTGQAASDSVGRAVFSKPSERTSHNRSSDDPAPGGLLEFVDQKSLCNRAVTQTYCLLKRKRLQTRRTLPHRYACRLRSDFSSCRLRINQPMTKIFVADWVSFFPNHPMGSVKDLVRHCPDVFYIT